jgi:hypothetical protein
MLVLSTIHLVWLLLVIALGVRFVAAIFSRASREAIARHPVVHLLLAAILLFIWFAPLGATLGYLSAKHDISRGQFAIQQYGLIRHPPLSIYSRILKERYDVRCPSTSCCAVMESEVEFDNAYNSVAFPEIIKHFGKDVFAECMEAADTEFRSEHQKK